MVITAPSGRLFWLNESGAFVWRLCNGKFTIEEIADAMIERYKGLDKNTAIRDLLELLLPMEKLELVRLL